MLTVASNPLSAKHEYFPELVLLALKLSVCPVATVFPFLIQVIFGVGLPVATHWNVASSSSSMVRLLGRVVKLGATAMNKNTAYSWKQSARAIYVHCAIFQQKLPGKMQEFKL